MSDELLRLENVHASYGSIPVLKGISLHVAAGEMVTIIGANGAGKSTLLMTISGIKKPESGRVLFQRTRIESRRPHDITAMGLSQVPEGRRIFSRLTVQENLELGAFLLKDRAILAERLEYCYSLFPILAQRRNQSGGTLSGGEQQMLAIARALIAKPSLLLLDEPSMGVAPILVQRIFECVCELNRHGLTILLVEQNAHMALNMCTRGYVLETGSIVLDAPTAELKENPEVRSAYLGS